MRKSIAAAVSATAVAALASGTGLAMASAHGAHPAVTGTEHFQMMTTSATSATAHVIASGVFTAPGADHENVSRNTARFVFPDGTIKLRHSPGTGQQSFNPRTCLLTIREHGTYRLTGGTGKYAGITGRGHYRLSILGIGARSHGKCSNSKPPAAFQQVIRATGTVRL
jgi:hypothetical protein